MVSLWGDQESWREGEEIEDARQNKWGENMRTHLEDLVVVRLKGVELDVEVSEIPQGHRLVSRAGRQDELGVGVK